MLRIALAALTVAAAVSSGCSGDSQIACEPADRYAAAGSIPAVRIPDDLSPPDESGALRVPTSVDASGRSPASCLETPPEFFEGGVGAEEARPTGVPAQPAQAPAEPAPVPSGDREITN
jgi:hypothetical protein